MNKHIFFALFIAVAPAAPAFVPAAAYAQDPPAQGAETGAGNPQLSPEADLEQHIAFLKSKLQITPAQESDWQTVTKAMRADIAEYQDMTKKYPPATPANPPAAPTSLQERVAFIDLRDKGEHRFLEAFTPLYNHMSPAQKKVADDLFANYPEP